MKAMVSATASSAMSNAAACCSISSTPRREHAGRPTETVRAELEAYGNGLAEKPEIVALSKADALDPSALKQQAARLKRAAKRAPLILSSATRRGVEDALRALAAHLPVSRAAGTGRRHIPPLDENSPVS